MERGSKLEILPPYPCFENVRCLNKLKMLFKTVVTVGIIEDFFTMYDIA